MGYKTRYKLVRLMLKGTRFVIPWLVRRDLDALTALMVRLHLVAVRKKRRDGDGAWNVILFPKDGFTEDALASLGPDHRFNLFLLDRDVPKAVVKAFLPKEIDDNNYRSMDPLIAEGKRRCRAFWVRVWKRLQKKIRIDMALTGNFAYFAEQELAAAASSLGTVFAAIHKECLKSPGLAGFYEDLYRNRRTPFKGKAICVYNEIEKEIQLNAGIISPDSVVLTGMPRLDRMHLWRKNGGGRPEGTPGKILFLSFGAKTGLPFISRKIDGGYETLPGALEKLSFDRLSKSCHEAMIRLAQNSPDIQVIIKAKNSKQSLQALKETLPKGSEMPRNIKVVAGGDVFDYIRESSVVCGFNTTAILEVIAAGKPVVIPWFTDDIGEKLRPFAVDYGLGVDYAETADDLTDRLLDYATRSQDGPEGTALTSDQQETLNMWAGNPDGRAGERVRHALIQLLERP